jgi:competence protein ComGC
MMKLKRSILLTRKPMTLVEVLCVMTLVVIILSLLFPGLNRMRQQSLRVGCASNLKQMNLAWSLYNQNNRGNLARFNKTDTYDQACFNIDLVPYYLDWRVRLCPASARQGENLRDLNQEGTIAYNVLFNHSYQTNPGSRVIRQLHQIKRVSTTPVFTDGEYSRLIHWSDVDHKYYWAFPRHSRVGKISGQWMGDGYNADPWMLQVAFADGSVNYMGGGNFNDTATNLTNWGMTTIIRGDIE